jgi:hypothetical protein
MPRKIVDLVANYDAISRPVAMGIARDVATLCGLGQVPVYMTNEFDRVKQNSGVLGDDDEPQWSGMSKLRVRATDSTRNEAVLNQITRQAEMPAVFDDRKLGISLRPIYQYSDIELEFKYTSKSRQDATQWRDRLVTKFAENMTSVQHEVYYEIPINEEILQTLAYFHELRENIAGYGDTLSEYIASIQRRQLKVIGTTKDGDFSRTTVVIPEKQAQAQGWFAFSEVPKEVKEDGLSTWTIDFTYKAVYHRCVQLYFVYPLMIHQQHVKRPLFDDRPRFAVDELPKHGAIGIRALDVIQGNVDYFPAPADGMRVPAYDEWIPGYRNQPQYSLPGISWMIQLDPNDPQDILNLTQIPTYRFTKEMDDYFREYYAGLITIGGAPIFFTLYNEDTRMSQDMLSIDKDLNIRAKVPLDLRRSYHLRLNFPTLYGQFTDKAIRSMQLNWKATLQIFTSIFPRLDVSYAISILIDDLYVPKSYIKWFYKMLEDKSIGFQDGTGGVGGPINRGEAGGLPGGGKSPGDGTGDWGYQDPWAREGDGHIKYLQWLSIIALRVD